MDSDYGKMTVAKLREIAEDRGIVVPSGAKKADIIDLLNAPVVVEAEVIDEPQEKSLAVNFTAGSIYANFDALEEVVDSILAQYDGWEPTSDNRDDLEQCARERKYLNGLAKQLDEKRKTVKNAYEQPLKAFEARCNGIRDKIKAVSGKLSAVEKEAEDFRKAEKKQALREHYEALAGVLVDIVPYEKIHDERWLNKTYQIRHAEAEIEDTVRRITEELKQLDSLHLEFHDDAEARYLDTLDLGAAIAWAGKLAEDKKRIAEMKAEVESREPAAQPQHVEQPPVAARRKPTLESLFGADKADALVAKIEAIGRTQDEKAPYVMVIDGATVPQLSAIGAFCGLLGVTGVFKRGTLHEVTGRR